jgi:hypothetical protein
MPLNASSGFIPTKTACHKAIKHHSRSTGALDELFNRTTVGHHHNGSQQPEDAKLENFDAIHYVGRKNSQYMKCKIKEAPLLNRTSCKYFNDYGAKPLGDHVCNRELAECFKGSAVAKCNIDFGNRTSYHENFNTQRTKEHFETANPPNFAPDKKVRTRTTGGTGETMVFTSKSQSDHIVPRKLSQQTEIALPKPNFMLGGTVSCDSYRTSYGDNHSKSMPSSGSLENLFVEMKAMKERKVKEEDKMFTTRRHIFLSPGQ